MKTSPTKNKSRRSKLLAGTVAALSMLAVPTVADAKAGISSSGGAVYTWNKPTRAGGTVHFSDCGLKGHACGSWTVKSVKLNYSIKGSTRVQVLTLPISGVSQGSVSYGALQNTVCNNKNAQVRVDWKYTGAWLPGSRPPADTFENVFGVISGGVRC